MIIGRLVQGVPTKRILQDIRLSVDNEELNRVHLTTRQDVQNIWQTYGINVSTTSGI